MCVEFIKQQGMNVQPLGTERVSREHPVKRVRRLVHDGLPAVYHLEVPRQRRRSPHHRSCLAVDDASLLAVAGRTVDFRPRLGVKGSHIEGDAGQRRALALLLGQLDVANPMLSGAIRVEPAEQLTQDVVLPRQQDKRLAGVLAFAVP